VVKSIASTRDVPAAAGGTPIRREYLVFGKPTLGQEEIDELVDTVRSGWLGTGPKTHRFEEMFGAYLEAPHAVAVSSCTAALHLALVACGLQPGDEVVVPSLTFVASANSVIHAGATPVLCDVDPATQVMRPEDLLRVLSTRTRAVMPVHFAGRAADLTALSDVTAPRGIQIVNDAAHAIETRHDGQPLPRWGFASAYSFYPTKNLTTGEGGMIVTADPALAERLRRLRQHGLSADAWRRYSSSGFQHYEAVEPGYKYNMTDMQAALGLHQLARLGASAVRRRAIWDRYDEAFADLPLERPAPVPAGDIHALHLYTALLRLDQLTATRDEVASALHQEGIGVGIHYRAVHLHEYYRRHYGYVPEALPNARDISERTISLPLGASLGERDVADVVAAVRRILLYWRR
jgi:dTDP-4-amino-4,6-dideoxygalactose transaminase